MADAPDPLKGARILLIEDEALVAMLLEDMLVDRGCTVAAVAHYLEDALARIRDSALVFDAAILDLNLNGEVTFSVAEALAARGTPFVFATGYGPGGLPHIWRGRPTLQKPFTANDVAAALQTALA